MDDCCQDKGNALEILRDRQRTVLVTVLTINALLFLVEFGAGLLSASTALLADSLDMLGDALVYGFSLWVLNRDALWKARAATFKGIVMVAFGLFVVGHSVVKVMNPSVPDAFTMETIALLALAANAYCLALLWHHRSDDVNMRSVWLCSRNDIVANVAVLGAGATVWWIGSQWPDLIVGIAIAALFLKSATTVLRDAATVRSAATV